MVFMALQKRKSLSGYVFNEKSKSTYIQHYSTTMCDTFSRYDLKIWIVIQTAVFQFSGPPFRQIVL